jgi:hypothetical protein
MDTYLCKLSVQLLRKDRDFMDHKDSESDSKTELV